ncbi:hypothetical protein FN846DRAFT_907678 [Sphaerosporella brunnea]|uniref:Postreplication repair E3 ubiquitin-protein ligase RAD18 n=1 Tax=Sphaerosporella brunnea TaxID=1250544 RepID=A0A5J5EVP8_9PEZI|nr:hypothetical protein FN846DRAFT_907678 [Sphaerosporella brunnea]
MAESTATDPTDWDGTNLPFISSLDAALRCEVCKEFYTAPVMTNCCHTFCSICIRRAFNNDGKCPACRTNGQEYQLRRNTIVQDLLDAFLGCRDKLFHFATKEQDSIFRDERESTPSNPQPSSQSQRPRRRAAAAAAAVKLSDDEKEDLQPVEPAPPPDDGLVACPVCSRRMKVDAINAHVNKCLDNPVPAPSAAPASNPALVTPAVRQLRSTRTATRSGPLFERLPKLTYSMLKDKQLRQKLRELGISDAGSRKLLEERHTEWITIWNANADATYPKSKKEMLDALNSWERAHTRPANNKTKLADWSDDNWAAKNSDDFSSLIEKARANAKRQKIEKVEMEPDSFRKETASAPVPRLSASWTETAIGPSSQPPISAQPNIRNAGMSFSPQPTPSIDAHIDHHPHAQPSVLPTESLMGAQPNGGRPLLRTQPSVTMSLQYHSNLPHVPSMYSPPSQEHRTHAPSQSQPQSRQLSSSAYSSASTVPVTVNINDKRKYESVE